LVEVGTGVVHLKAADDLPVLPVVASVAADKSAAQRISTVGAAGIRAGISAASAAAAEARIPTAHKSKLRIKTSLLTQDASSGRARSITPSTQAAPHLFEAISRIKIFSYDYAMLFLRLIIDVESIRYLLIINSNKILIETSKYHHIHAL
jgi:hypothetical protein